MAVKLRFHREFLADVEEYGSFYELRRTGAGEQFAKSVEAALKELIDRPMSHQFLWKHYRRVLIRRFRTVVPFEILDDAIHILGVVHGSRDLPAWINRRSSDDE